MRLIGLLLLISQLAFAQGVRREIRDLMKEIRQELPGDHSRADLKRVRQKLKKALAILKGEAVVRPASRITCVSRDNDNANPYQIAEEDESGKITRLASGVIGSRDRCQPVLDSSISVARGHLFCGTRDNDGANPFAIIASSGGNAFQVGVVGDFSRCQKIMKRTVQVGRTVRLCVTRDNDGNNPWIKAVYDGRTHKLTRQTESFSSLDSCLSAL